MIILLASFLCMTAICFAAVSNTRAAYRNGVRDGWKAAHSPTDPLWETVGVNQILRDANYIHFTTPPESSP